jgi:hypothetical protein
MNIFYFTEILFIVVVVVFWVFFFRENTMINSLIIHCFTSRSQVFLHSYGDVTITGERLQNLGLSSVLRAFKQGGIFIVPYLL